METQKFVTLLLARHGQAQSNVSRILTSYPEVVPKPLSEKGREEVRDSAQKVKELQIDAIYASPLTRTQETAAIFAEVVQKDIITDLRLRETDFGNFNNTSYAQFFTRYPHPKLRRAMAKESGAEGLDDVRARAKEFLHFLLSEHSGQAVLVVTHADVIREMFSLIEGKESWISVPTGSVHKVVLKNLT